MSHSYKRLQLFLFNLVRKIQRILNPLKIKDPLIISWIGDIETSQKKQRIIEWYLPGINYRLSDQDLRKADIILLRDFSILNYFQVLFYARKLFLVDPNFLGTTEVSNWTSLYYSIISKSEKSSCLKQSSQNLKSFREKYKDLEYVNIFGTGPSLIDFNKRSHSNNTLNIICNSIICNSSFLEENKPHVLCFADPLFHFGHSSYAFEFRKDLESYLQKYNGHVFIPDFNLPLMKRHFKGYESRWIGLKYSRNFNLPNPSNLNVKRTENILSLFMLPIAASLSQKIFLIGMDGRKKEESKNYFWKHSNQFQYSESLLNQAKTEHPSFFENRNYTGYNSKHDKQLENLFSRLEAMGCTIKSYFKSNLASVQKRFVSQ